MFSRITFWPNCRSEFAEEEAAVVAGIVGFNVKEENNIRTKEAKTSIQAKHAWALLLDQDSAFRKKEDSFSQWKLFPTGFKTERKIWDSGIS